MKNAEFQNYSVTDGSGLETEIDALFQLMPDGREEAALRLGALHRKRQIRDADTLLRLALAYSWLDLSLRNVVAWAAQQNLVRLADVSLLERLQKAVPLLAWLLMRLLQTKLKPPAVPKLPYRVRLIDATVISEPGSKGTDWRVHMQMDLSDQSIGALQVTDSEGGECFTRFSVQQNDLLVGDRAYATRASICHVVDAGGHVLVRFAWQNLPFLTRSGVPFDLIAHLSTLSAEGQSAEWEVRTAPTQDYPSVPGRIIAVRKSAQQAEAARRTALKNARKKGHTPDARTLHTCDYLLLFTTAPAEDIDTAALLGLYRYRWQIECGFKRMKSLLCLDELRAKEDALCQAYLYGKLIGAILTDRVSGPWSAFSPSDECDYATSDLAVASAPDDLVDTQSSIVGIAPLSRVAEWSKVQSIPIRRHSAPKSPETVGRNT